MGSTSIWFLFGVTMFFQKWLLSSQAMTKDLATYWSNNQDLAETMWSYWNDSGEAPANMEQVFPVRFYGDGADTIGLNAFELLTMISVSPKHSSTLKTRFVFLGLCTNQNLNDQSICKTTFCAAVRLSVRNTSYTDETERDKLLNIMAWSFTAMWNSDSLSELCFSFESICIFLSLINLLPLHVWSR